MADRTNDREILEKLTQIENSLRNLSGKVDDLTGVIKNVFMVSDKSGSQKTGISDYRGMSLAPFEELETDPHKDLPNPWTMKSIESFSKGRKIDVDIRLLADPKSLLPTLKALKSNPQGLTAKEVSKITKRNRTTEANYLSKMFKLGILDKVKFGRNTKYKLSEKMTHQSIKDQI